MKIFKICKLFVLNSVGLCLHQSDTLTTEQIFQLLFNKVCSKLKFLFCILNDSALKYFDFL